MGLDVERFTAPLPSHLTCPVCLDALTGPFTVCALEHALCGTCLEGLRGQNSHGSPRCPTCRQVVAAKPSLLLKRALLEYEVKCERKAAGCEWVGNVGDEKKHGEEQCAYRPVPCPDCHMQLPFNVLTQHSPVCPMALVACARGGADCGGAKGGGRFRRLNTAQHDAVCAEFACRLGCGTRTAARNLGAHEQICASMRHAYYDIVAQLQSARKEIAALQTPSAGWSTATLPMSLRLRAPHPANAAPAPPTANVSGTSQLGPLPFVGRLPPPPQPSNGRFPGAGARASLLCPASSAAFPPAAQPFTAFSPSASSAASFFSSQTQQTSSSTSATSDNGASGTSSASRGGVKRPFEGEFPGSLGIVRTKTEEMVKRLKPA
ncbi:hypothetical protein JCM10213_000263 [Rhodosporidiobolus nylandii]